METEYIKGKNGYDIPYYINLPQDAKKIIIAAHGFGSSKGSPTVLMLLEKMPPLGIGVLGYDHPNHGESASGPEGLRIDKCISDLGSVEEFVAENWPQAEICYFASSFGAYITLQYLAGCRHRGTKAFLRSAAVNMPVLFSEPTPEQQEALRRDGRVQLEGYEPPLVITSGFVDDMNSHDLFDICERAGAGGGKVGGTQIAMIHGSCDSTIDPAEARRFADMFGIPITMVPGAEHRLMEEGQPEMVFEKARELYSGTESQK
ncbi:MAG: alpha/beta hydrolase [Anaerovoracaceae bacterium]|jgi:alpha-beta hydrolase superfamily lysophospholipase